MYYAEADLCGPLEVHEVGPHVSLKQLSIRLLVKKKWTQLYEIIPLFWKINKYEPN